MKKSILILSGVIALASCAKVTTLDPEASQGKEGPIGFVMGQDNMVKSYTGLQEANHYNFGVFAYKSTDLVTPVMPNYIVGYYDDAKAYQKSGTTVGDEEGLFDGASYWMYEGMGNAEYKGTYAGKPITAQYSSNNANQYLKYWDMAADYTNFIAYAPYINGAGTATYVDGTAQAATGADTRVLNIPNGTLKDGYDNPELAEYMYASAHVAKADYGHDVALKFKRLNAKVNIKFWEDVPGYKVRILTLQEGTHDKGVYAAPAISKDNDHSVGTYGVYGYRKGTYYTKNGVKIQFDANAEKTKSLQYEGTTAQTPLTFEAPTQLAIGTNRYEASKSATTYYAIPKGSTAAVLVDGNMDIETPGGTLNTDLKYTGFTFHVSYLLTAEDTGETITVSDATVFVPASFCNWKENTHYTYIFKITKNSNGSTAEPGTIDPTDPEVPTTPALYPIIFDNCTVEDWEENESEWNTPATDAAYHNIVLSAYSIATNGGTIHIDNITDQDEYKDHAINWDNIVVYAPNGTATDYYKVDGHNIVVPATAAAGVYTVEYTCSEPAEAHTNHPVKWTQTFWVGNAYTVTTALAEVATKGAADTKLVMTATKDGSDVTAAAATAEQLSIDYPDNFTDDQKGKVYVDKTNGIIVVKKDATPGVYQLVYKVDEGKSVMVAKKEFSVVDKSFTLSQTEVVNCVAGTVVRGSQAADATHVYTVTGGLAVSGNAITVPNDTPENTYTVTYTVNGGTDSQVVYTQTFTVVNQYAVTLDKYTLDSIVGTSAIGDVSTDKIIVAPAKNQVATDTDLTGSLKVVAADAANTATADDNFAFAWDGTAEKITLTVKRGAVKTGYKVVYEGQTGVYAIANFVVK